MTYLLILLLILTMMQPAGNRRAACCIFALSISGFDLLCGNLPGEIYFFAAAINSAVCFVLLGRLNPMPFMAYVLQRFCAVSIFLNATGYLFYESGMSATPYVTSFQVFHVLAIILFVYGGPAYRYFKGNQRNRWFCLSHDMGGNINMEAEI